MDPEAKQLLQKNLEIAEDTNRMVHKLRRGAAYGRLLTLLFWFIFVILPLAASVYYLQPYLGKIQQIYSQFQSSSQQAQNYQKELSSFFANFTPSQIPTTTAP